MGLFTGHPGYWEKSKARSVVSSADLEVLHVESKLGSASAGGLNERYRYCKVDNE